MNFRVYMDFKGASDNNVRGVMVDNHKIKLVFFR